VEGQHVAAWSWELWHRIDEATAVRRGSRGQQRGTRGTPEEHWWLFLAIVVCAACGNRLRADGNYTRSGKHYGYYRDEAAMRGLTCSEGGRLAVREDVLEQQFYDLLAHYRLPADFRARIAEVYARAEQEQAAVAAGGAPRETSSSLRQALEAELERVKFQHQHGLLTDNELLREVRRLRSAIEVLPQARADDAPLARSLEAAETLEALVGYWAEATREERREFVQLFVLPE
jgi:hypothetical protein